MKLSGGGKVISSPTIDDIDPSSTPSLVGFWKCDEGSGLILHDSSGNGYDLQLACHASQLNDEGFYPACGRSGETVAGNIAASWNKFPGRFAPYSGIGAMISLDDAPLLDTGSNIVIYGCDFFWNYDDGLGPDYDCGTYWAGEYDDGGAVSFPQQAGFNWACGSSVGAGNSYHWNRIQWESAGTQYVAALPDYQVLGGVVTTDRVQPNQVGGTCACFHPSTRFEVAYFDSLNERLAISSVTQSNVAPTGQSLPASLGNQGNMFGLRGQDRPVTKVNYGPNSGIKNFYVWSFETEPPYLRETIAWLARNPGKIPSWWIGK